MNSNKMLLPSMRNINKYHHTYIHIKKYKPFKRVYQKGQIGLSELSMADG